MAATFSEVQPSQLSLFDLPGYQTAVEKVTFQQIRPISQLSNDAPIEFYISSQNSMEYIDLQESNMYVKLKIVNGDGSRIAETASVGPVNFLLHALFSQIDVMVQNKIVTSSTGHYPYKAMMQTLIKYGKEAKESQLTSQMWIDDTPGTHDDSSAKTGSNTGLYRRTLFFEGGKSVEMQGHIFHPLFALQRYILNSVGISIKFYRTKPDFFLMSDETNPDYKVEIEDMYLNICKITCTPGLIYGHAKILEKVPAKYPYINTDVKMMAIPQGQVSFTWNNVFQDVRPKKIIIGFVSSRAVAGDFKLSPWNFQHFNLNQIAVMVDGNPVSGNAQTQLQQKKMATISYRHSIICSTLLVKRCTMQEMT